jgi:DNA-binding transcriptional MerR regulator
MDGGVVANDGGAGRAEAVTVDELAREAGIPVSTVRLYQNRGLLPSPERRGRVGYFGEHHRDRLRLIAHLQGRGFSLAAIKEAFDAWAGGRSLDHLMGVGDIAPALRREPLRLAPSELAERFAGIPLTPHDMQRAVAVGLVSLDGTDVIVSNAAFAEIGPAVARLGVPVGEILDEYEALRDAVAAIAERFRVVFERHVWADFVDAGMPAERVPALTNDVEQLAALATAVLDVELRERFAALAASYVEQAQRRRASTVDRAERRPGPDAAESVDGRDDDAMLGDRHS